MFNAERRQFILETIEAAWAVVATELSRGLGVSEDTIRRDLRDIALSV
jgi:DeoR/GlpR family transcriptional regulator of sugar metabolism